MASSTFCTFTDPDAYHAAIRTQPVTGVALARGHFHAELTRIDFDRLLTQRFFANLAHVLNFSTNPRRTAILFAAGQNQPEMHVSGIRLSSGEVVAWGSGLAGHYRSTAASTWGAMTVANADLAATGEVVTGRELVSLQSPHRIRTPAPELSRLLNLHQTACHLAKTAPDILAEGEVGRAIEQALMEAMIACLVGGNWVNLRSVHRHHSRVMRRLEQVLEANPEGPLYISELCQQTGVSYPTLRACCQEHFGVSPKRYLLLRRMHLARRALRQAGAGKTSVTDVATLYGFWELGRFSVVYRSLFGESPSVTLRRAPDDPRPAVIVASPWQFTKTA